MACRGVMKWRRELLHICESKCFIWKGVLWSTLCLARLRRVKHTKVWSATYAAWSGTACHEAKPFQASCFFSPSGQKKWSGYGDSNSGPFDPQSNALNQAALYPDYFLIYTPLGDISSGKRKNLQSLSGHNFSDVQVSACDKKKYRFFCCRPCNIIYWGYIDKTTRYCIFKTRQIYILFFCT